jgi:Rrf2 family protein
MSILRRGGLIRSTRGQVGGYKLARSSDRISVADVLAVLGGRLYDTDFCNNHTGNSEDCRHSTDCAVRALWKTVQESIDRVLARTTLRDLIRSEDEMTSWINIAPHLERADQPGSRR